MRVLLSISLFLCTIYSVAQTTLDSVGHLDYSILHNTVLNDIWGYEDESGNEYALVGAEDGFSVVDVTTPSAPVEIFWEPGLHSVWRDVKSWGDYFYVSTEAENGLLIVNGTDLPSSTSLSVVYFTGDGAVDWLSAHNLYIDELGYLYVFGANYDVGGVLIYDIFTDPLNPSLVGQVQGVYSHDGYVKDDKLYLAHISDGFFSIHDISDRSNPVLLGSHVTPTTLSHNIWSSDDGNYVFTTDEVEGGYIASYDVTDPANIVEVDKTKHNPQNNVIPHNTHVLNDYLITSYYTAGVVIHDVQHPDNMVEVAQFKTFPQENPTYDGCWGVYPFFSSGLIAASDRTEGLFLLNPTYDRAAYLKGVVTEEGSGVLINNAEIQIDGFNDENFSNTQGAYACGVPSTGTFDVVYSKIGYFPKTISVDFMSDQIVTENVELTPIPTYNLTVRVFESDGVTPIPNAQIVLEADLIDYSGVANGLGEEDFVLQYQEEYNVIVGQWGFKTKCELIQIDDQTSILDVILETGYYDDFTFDFGWTNTSTSIQGIWERGVPAPTNTNLSPTEDVNFDCGNQLMITGNTTQVWGHEDDVSIGKTTLISPVFDLSNMSEPYIHCYDWFLNVFGNGPENDTARYLLNNGTTEVEVLKYGGAHQGEWRERTIKISDFLSPTNTMQLKVEVTEYVNNHILEMAFDDFKIIEETALALSEVKQERLLLFPNPARDKFKVNVKEKDRYVIYDLNGVMVSSGALEVGMNEINVSSLESGVYLFSVKDTVIRLMKTK